MPYPPMSQAQPEDAPGQYLRQSVPVEQFGKDHWSLLAYVETCCVDGHRGVGTIDYRRLRCNPHTHPLLSGSLRGPRMWKPEYGTRLRGYWREDHTTNTSMLILDHDDIDCLDDLVDAGLIEIDSLINGFVRMTSKGMRIASAIREHKVHGGQFATFVPSSALLAD